MRVVYLCQYFNTPEMSGGSRPYEFARRLVAAGHDVHMITSDRRRTGKPYETIEAGIRVTWIPVPYSNRMGTLERLRSFAVFAMRSARYAAASDADVVFATSTPLTITLPAVYAKWRQRIPMVFEVRDLWPELPIAMGVLKDPISRRVARLLERFAYRNSAHVVALSPGMKAGIVAAGYPEKKVTVIPNASDVELLDVDPQRGETLRTEYEWLGNRKLVVYTGTLGPINGVSFLAEIAGEMWHLNPEVRFLVVGEGRDEKRVRERADHLGVLGKNFFMLPRIPKEDIPSVLSAADVCVSLFIDVKEMWANSANKFFDALAAGRPVAINYGGWQAELLLESGAGVVMEASDPSSAAMTLNDLLSDEERLAAASQRAGNLAKTRFDRAKLTLELERVLVEAASSTPT